MLVATSLDIVNHSNRVVILHLSHWFECRTKGVLTRAARHYLFFSHIFGNLSDLHFYKVQDLHQARHKMLSGKTENVVTNHAILGAADLSMNKKLKSHFPEQRQVLQHCQHSNTLQSQAPAISGDL